MYALDYQLAPTLAQAQQALAADPQAKLLAGGMTLIPVLKHRLAAPSQLIDISRLPELRGIEVQPGHVWVGAGTRHCDVEASAVLQQALPGLARLAGSIGDAQVRARGTLGGSVANNDPAADYPAALLALQAVVVSHRAGQAKETAAEGFFVGMFSTALQADDIVTGVRFKRPLRSSYAKFAHPATGYAMAGVYAADFGGGIYRVAVTGAAAGVCRWPAAEAAWAAGRATAVFESAELMGDMHAPGAYRAHLATLMFEQALKTLV